MPIDKRPLLAKIHIAKKDLNLSDEVYRDILHRVTKKDSTAKMTLPQLEAVISEFKLLGWKAQKHKKPVVSDKAYVRKIFAQWEELKRLKALKNPSAEGLRRFVSNLVGVDNPEWLDYKKASPVINALNSWIDKAKKEDDYARKSS